MTSVRRARCPEPRSTVVLCRRPKPFGLQRRDEVLDAVAVHPVPLQNRLPSNLDAQHGGGDAGLVESLREAYSSLRSPASNHAATPLASAISALLVRVQRLHAGDLLGRGMRCSLRGHEIRTSVRKRTRRPTCAQLGTARRLWLTDRTVEAHVGSIMVKLGLAASDEEHRRVLAVLVYLRGATPRPQSAAGGPDAAGYPAVAPGRTSPLS